jgi:hypothetical protein
MLNRQAKKNQNFKNEKKTFSKQKKNKNKNRKNCLIFFTN